MEVLGIQDFDQIADRDTAPMAAQVSKDRFGQGLGQCRRETRQEYNAFFDTQIMLQAKLIQTHGGGVMVISVPLEPADNISAELMLLLSEFY